MSANLPPGDDRLSLVQLVRWVRTPIEVLETNYKRFGPMFGMKLPVLPKVFFVSDPAIIREVFTGDTNVFLAGAGNRVLRATLGDNSLLMLDGHRHLRERKMMMPPFHGERMRAYGEAMREITSTAIDSIRLGEPFTMHALAQSITLDVILRTVFGFDSPDTLARMRERIVKFTELGTSPLGTLITFLLPPDHATEILQRSMLPFALGPFRVDLSWAMPWRKVVQARREVDQMLYEQIRERRNDPNAAQREDVLSMLLQSRDESGAAMTDDELRDEMITLLLAGHETSATTLAWAMHHIVSNPTAHAKLKAEIHAVMGDGPLKLEQLGSMPYTDAVLKETLRLTPIVPLVARILSKPTRVGGFDLPAGVGVMPSIYLTHHREDLWPEPARFLPERFLDRKADPYSYFPFGGGTRRCLGLAFANYEMKIVLAEIIRRLDLRAVPGPPVRIVRRAVTFAPSGGVKLIADARRDDPARESHSTEVPVVH